MTPRVLSTDMIYAISDNYQTRILHVAQITSRASCELRTDLEAPRIRSTANNTAATAKVAKPALLTHSFAPRAPSSRSPIEPAAASMCNIVRFVMISSLPAFAAFHTRNAVVKRQAAIVQVSAPKSLSIFRIFRVATSSWGE